MKNRLLTLVVVIIIAGVSVLAVYLYRNRFAGGFDERLKTAIGALQSIHTYEMSDSTHASVLDRTIDIEGVYRLDFDANAYESVSTTSVTLHEQKAPKNMHAFTLAHRSIRDDIYVQILTDSPLLQKTIPYGPDWKHFKAAEIPARFVDIAVPGPILDNLALFGENGAYLSLQGKQVDVVVASTTYHAYTFSLSDRSAEVQSGPLKGLIDLIATGTVTVLIDDEPSVRLLRISGPSYQSTTTIVRVNTPLSITAPTGAE